MSLPAPANFGQLDGLVVSVVQDCCARLGIELYLLHEGDSLQIPVRARRGAGGEYEVRTLESVKLAATSLISGLDSLDYNAVSHVVSDAVYKTMMTHLVRNPVRGAGARLWLGRHDTQAAESSYLHPDLLTLRTTLRVIGPWAAEPPPPPDTLAAGRPGSPRRRRRGPLLSANPQKERGRGR